MQTITEIRGKCSAPISHTKRRCQCTHFVPGFHRQGIEFNLCQNCWHTDGVHRIEARA